MNALATLYRTTIGQKVVMAVTGLIMVGWLLLHMGGNLLVFLGPEEFNSYAEWIQSGFGASPEFLWGMRLIMLGAIVFHIRSAAGLVARNRAARPSRYAVHTMRRTTYAARFMMLGGLVVLLFLLFHLAHLTLGAFPVDPMSGVAFERGDAYHNLVNGLGNPVLALVYIVANLALAAHLWHGVTSGMQTLGLNHPRYDAYKRGLGVLLPLLICGGNILIAVGVVAGLTVPA